MAYRRYDSPPIWYQDSKWLSGILLVLVVMALLLVVTLAQVSSPGPGRAVLQTVLAMTLFPDGLEAATLPTVELPTQASIDEPLELVTGVAVFAAAEELDGLTPESARLRVANALADLILREGLQGTLTRVANPQLARQLSADFVSDLSWIHLEAAMLPAGLADGSRLADWRQQRANRPGQPVQPIVGVFVLVEPNELEPLTNRDIGVLVVRRLNEVLLTQGLPAAQALVGNANLLQRLNDTAQGEIRRALGAFLATALIAEEPAIARRLTQARAAAQEATAAPVPWLGPELADLPPAEANALVLQQVSEVIYDRGLTEALAIITEPDARLRIGAALEPFSAFTASRHGHWLRLSWLLGALALVLGGLLVFFSSGFSRVINLGLALLLAAVPGALLFAALEQALVSSAAPTLPRVEGALASLKALARYLVLNIPDDVAAIALRNHLTAVIVGAALALWLVMTVRPRRRRF
jgi:hypothetical protein